MIEAEPGTPYTFSAWGRSSDHAGTYEPLVYAMEVDCNGRIITQHNLNFGGCYDWVEKELGFTTSHNNSKFYVHANTWECNDTFQVEDVVLEVCEVSLPGITDLGHIAGSSWINWTWANPNIVGFSYVMVYLVGVWQVNTSDTFYNATGLDFDGCYEIGVRTVGVDRCAGEVWANQTGETTGGGAGFAVRTSDSLEFNFAKSGAISGVSIDDVEMPMLSVPGGFSFRELSPTVSENLIANPGFENVSGGLPLNWTLVGGAGTVVYDAVEGHGGPGSIRVDIMGITVMQSGYPKSDPIDAKPGTPYTFSAWGKSSGVGGSHAPVVSVVEIDSDGGWITQHSLVFDRDSDWEEKKTGFITSSDVSTLHVYANIWESYGTFWVDDLTLETCGTGDVPLEGAVEMNDDGSITQYVTESDIAFRFDYIPRDRYIEVHGGVQDLRGVDRAIQVQYVLPVDATGWQWGDYIRKSREIESGVRYENVYKIGEVRTQNMYPFTFVGEDEQGLSLAVPMDVPRIYRIGYGTGSGGYSIEYDFGLANCTDKIGHGYANFTFIVYKVNEPEWGFRAVAKKYYELYPEFFVKRVEKEGLVAKWDFAVSPVANVTDFGVAYADEYTYSGFGRMTDSGDGIGTLVYSEPWGWWKDLGAGCTEPTYDEKLAIIQDDYLNGSDNTTWKGMANDSYVAEVIMNCMPYDKTGRWAIDHDYLWKGEPHESLNYPTNSDPDLPSPNRFELTYMQFENSTKSGIGCYDWKFGNNYFPRNSLNNWTLNSAEYHSGNYLASITVSGTPRSDTAMYSMEYIPASPSTPYNFSAWGKVRDVQGNSSPIVKMDEFDIDKTYLGATQVSYGYGSTAWVKKSNEFTTRSNTAFICPALHNGITNGTFYVDDIELYKNGIGDNLIKNHDFESVYNFNDYPCGGLRIDTVTTDFTWSLFENYRRSHWKYTDYPLVFSYDTKEPVLLGALSQYEFLENMHLKMIDEEKTFAGNVFAASYSFYPHLLDVLGSERWDSTFDDWCGCACRTMCYQKPISNILVWNYQGPGDITHSEVEVYINDQMFYGMFPSMDWYNKDSDRYWGNSTIYERDRDLFVKYIPIVTTLSDAGWEPIPYATCDNPDIKFERYGSIDEGLYYTVGNIGSEVRSGALTIDLSKLGFDGTQVEVRELVTDRACMQDVPDGKLYLSIVSLNLHDTRVYRLVS